MNKVELKASHFVIAGFTLAAASAWSEFTTKLFNNYFPGKKENVIGHAIYTFLLTIFVIAIIILDDMYFSGYVTNKLTEEKKKEKLNIASHKNKLLRR